MLSVVAPLLGAWPDSRRAPPLHPPSGRVVRVADATTLAKAVREAQGGDTIMVADGEYRMPRFLHMNEASGVTLRGESGDPRAAVLMGQGWESGDKHDDILRISHCRGVTVAYLTFADCRAYGIKVEGEHFPEDVHIYDCRFRDIGTRAIKGSASRDCTVRRGSVRFCDFENTKIPPADWLFGGDYISAIDMMALDGWVFSDNAFRSIRGRNGGGRAAIFVWVRSRNVVVERNVIVNCDRGIAFGNPSASTATSPDELHVCAGVCRNNVVVCGPDAGIELAWVDAVDVYHNTVWRAEGRGRGIRCIEKITNTRLTNNLVRGEIMLTDGVSVRRNLVGPLDGYFVDPEVGDLRLTDEATEAVDKAVPLPDVPDDVAGRPRGPLPDIGAHERFQ